MQIDSCIPLPTNTTKYRNINLNYIDRNSIFFLLSFSLSLSFYSYLYLYTENVPKREIYTQRRYQKKGYCQNVKNKIKFTKKMNINIVIYNVEFGIIRGNLMFSKIYMFPNNFSGHFFDNNNNFFSVFIYFLFSFLTRNILVCLFV